MFGFSSTSQNGWEKISEDVALWNLICAKSTEHNLSRNKEQYTREKIKKKHSETENHF